MPNILDILARAQSLMNETALNSITPPRAGGIMYDTLLVLNQMQLEGASLLISKVYASVSAMEADTTPTSDLTGRALKPGQLVVIVTSNASSSDMGSEYRYNGPGSWTYVGKVGGLPLDTVPTQNSTKGITSGGVYAAQAAIEEDLTQLEDKVINKLGGNITPSLDIEQGGIASADGTNTSSNTRIRTSNYIYGDKIGVGTSGSKVYVMGYAEDGTYIDSEGWITSSRVVSIKGADKYRLTFAKSNDGTITPSGFDSLGVTITCIQDMEVALESEVKEVSERVPESEILESLNILDTDTMIVVGGEYLSKTTGKPRSSNDGYGYTDFIPVTPNGLVCNNTLTLAGTYGCTYCVYDEYYHFLRNGGTGNAQASYTYQQGDAFVRFNLGNPAKFAPGGTLEGQNYAVFRTTTLPPYEECYRYSQVKTNGIKDKAVTREKADFIIFSVGKNKCNPNDPNFKLNYQITYSDGTELEWAGSNAGRVGCTGFIPVSERGLILNHYATIGLTSGMAVYDSNFAYIRGARSGEYTYQPGDAYARFTFGYAYRDEIQVEEGTEVTTYEQYDAKWILDPTKVSTPPVSSEQILAVLPGNGYYPDSVQISLPDKIYAVRGDKLQIFYQGIVVCPNIELYDIVVTCSVGKGLYRYYEYNVPDNASLGIKSWTITVKDANGNVLGVKTCQLVIVDKPTSPGSNKNILCIGDSLTANGVWASEFKRRLVGTSGTGTPSALGLSNLAFIGRKSLTPSGMGQVNLEGNSGWSWKDYALGRAPKFRFYLASNDYAPQIGDVYTNNGHSYTVDEVNEIEGVLTILTSVSSILDTPEASGALTLQSGGGPATMNYTSYTTDSANPFWDGNNNELSFTNYVENVCNLPEGTKIDYAYFLMTWNQVPDGDDWTTFMGYAKDIIDALHADYPDCKVKLMSVEFVYPPTYISATSSQKTMDYIRKIARMNEEYQALANSDEESGTSGDAYNTFVEFVNVSSQFDSKYNMTNTERDVNTRNSAYKERYTNNSIHPANPGYLQIADIAYRNMCGDMNN